MISAKIVADSVNPTGTRLTSYIVVFPRIILAELNTHRVFSRNSASSRAIPLKKMIEMVLANPFVPYRWGKNQKGMQAREELDPHDQRKAKKVWLRGLKCAVAIARRLETLGVHKQIANRVLEPWSYMTTLVTGTFWDNFFSLRAHGDAEDHFQILGHKMLDAYLKSTPKLVEYGGWHFPFPDKLDGIESEEIRLKVSTARCARLSYLTFDGRISVEDDCRLHDQLIASGHMSPTEHSAKSVDEVTHEGDFISNFGYGGWAQYRKYLPNEAREDVDLKAVSAARPEWIHLEE